MRIPAWRYTAKPKDEAHVVEGEYDPAPSPELLLWQAVIRRAVLDATSRGVWKEPFRNDAQQYFASGSWRLIAGTWAQLDVRSLALGLRKRGIKVG